MKKTHFEQSEKVIIFGAHEKEYIYADHQKIVECSLCGHDMYINIGMYPGQEMEFDVPPPEKYDLVFAKECFAELAKILVNGAKASSRYLNKS